MILNDSLYVKELRVLGLERNLPGKATWLGPFSVPSVDSAFPPNFRTSSRTSLHNNMPSLTTLFGTITSTADPPYPAL